MKGATEERPKSSKKQRK